jgi:hypothetical protein
MTLIVTVTIVLFLFLFNFYVDNCAMWLNGFNDNAPGYPKVECERVKCPDPYMNSPMYEQPGAPPNPTKGKQDPYGASGESYVEYGYCPRDQAFPDDDINMQILSYSKLHAFDLNTHGNFFWNFRTEFEPRWDYLEAVKKGWIPIDFKKIETMAMISESCMLLQTNDLKDEGHTIRHLLITLFLISVVTYLIFIIIKHYVYGKRYQYQNINGTKLQPPINSDFSESVTKFYDLFGRNLNRARANGVEMSGIVR